MDYIGPLDLFLRILLHTHYARAHTQPAMATHTRLLSYITSTIGCTLRVVGNVVDMVDVRHASTEHDGQVLAVVIVWSRVVVVFSILRRVVLSFQVRHEGHKGAVCAQDKKTFHPQ